MSMVSNMQIEHNEKMPDLCICAMESFPLPDQGKSSEENYKRILHWLYSGKRNESPANLVIELIDYQRTKG